MYFLHVLRPWQLPVRRDGVSSLFFPLDPCMGAIASLLVEKAGLICAVGLSNSLSVGDLWGSPWIGDM